jgi:hypothetical protein
LAAPIRYKNPRRLSILSNVGCPCGPQPKFLFFVAAKRQQKIKEDSERTEMIPLQKS